MQTAYHECLIQVPVVEELMLSVHVEGRLHLSHVLLSAEALAHGHGVFDLDHDLQICSLLCLVAARVLEALDVAERKLGQVRGVIDGFIEGIFGLVFGLFNLVYPGLLLHQ